MHLRLLDYLECPKCRAPFAARVRETDGDHVMQGSIDCARCGDSHPIDRGIPRIFPSDMRQESIVSALNFGGSWELFGTMKEMYEGQFLDWIRFHSLDRSFFEGKVILDFGCGKGRHCLLSSKFGAREIVAVDVSPAVDVAFRNTRHLPNVHIVQCDIGAIPVRQATFDYVYSIGVLHHLPDPEQGFRIALSCVRPGGSLSIWVYGRENNGWIVHLVNPLRALTSRLPLKLLYWLSLPLAVFLFCLLRTVYVPLGSRAPSVASRLFYKDYMLYISHFNFNEIHSVVVDHLTAPIAHYLRREEIEAWFHRAGVDQVTMRWHNANSWSALVHGCSITPGQLVHSARVEPDRASDCPGTKLPTA